MFKHVNIKILLRLIYFNPFLWQISLQEVYQRQWLLSYFFLTSCVFGVLFLFLLTCVFWRSFLFLFFFVFVFLQQSFLLQLCVSLHFFFVFAFLFLFFFVFKLLFSSLFVCVCLFIPFLLNFCGFFFLLFSIFAFFPFYFYFSSHSSSQWPRTSPPTSSVNPEERSFKFEQIGLSSNNQV